MSADQTDWIVALLAGIYGQGWLIAFILFVRLGKR